MRELEDGRRKTSGSYDLKESSTMLEAKILVKREVKERAQRVIEPCDLVSRIVG